MHLACAASTTEFEKAPADSLASLAKYLPVRPDAGAVGIRQDRGLEEVLLKVLGADQEALRETAMAARAVLGSRDHDRPPLAAGIAARGTGAAS